MNWLRELARRLRMLVDRRQFDADLEEEMSLHLEMRQQQQIEAGMTAAEARYAALRRFGNRTLLAEKSHSAWGWRWFEDLVQDAAYGLRLLNRNPGFTVVAVLTLALGIGANTAIFSLIDAVMLKMLPVEKPEQLVLLNWVAPGWPYMIHSLSGDSDRDKSGRSTSTSFSYPIFEDIRARAQAFSGVLAFADAERVNVGVGGEAGVAQGQLVSGDFFSMLGVPASIGRTITPADNEQGASPVATISYNYWVKRFGRDPQIVGKTFTVNRVPFTLVGVAAPEFFGVQTGTSIDIWLPLRTQPVVDPSWIAYATPGETSKFTAHDDWWVVIMGRLKPGASDEQARAALDVIVQQESSGIEKPPAKPSPEQALEPPKVELTPAGGGLDELRSQFSEPLLILMCVVGLVLLIACANVANLLLARAASRQKEIAVRLALGGGRERLIRQLLVESVMLALAGGAVGVFLAYWASDVLLKLMSSGREPITLHVAPNLGVLAFTAGVSALTGILFGLAPALRGTRLDLTPALKEGAARIIIGSGSGAQSSGRRQRLSQALVVVQIAMSLVLLIGAGLFVRSLTKLENENVGFDRRNLLLFTMAATQAGYKADRLATFYEQLQKRIEAIPGVRSVCFSRHGLINAGISILGFSLQGFPAKPGEQDNGPVRANSVGPEFFETFAIPLVLGRTIGEQDTATAPKIAVVNRAFAQEYFSGQSPIGHRFGFGHQETSSDIVIVGVVGDSRYGKLRDDPLPTVYVPLYQHINEPDVVHFSVRTAGNPKDWISGVGRAVQGLDRNLPIFDVKTEVEEINQATLQERLFAELTGFFGMLALALAAIGLYGMISYAVSRRTNEIGIRIALGARRTKILQMVLREAMLVAALGVAVGAPAAFVLSRLVGTLLYGLKPTDPLTVASATSALLFVGFLAAYLPAQRAARIEPLAALRHE
ncbi:MAG TPA: ABC transporter permease [Terriglobales bacterium]|nr:ABC transporter permease [Terriglobales bacterium]